MTPESYKAARLNIALLKASIYELTGSERPQPDNRHLYFEREQRILKAR
jgi:hypothetical protein